MNACDSPPVRTFDRKLRRVLAQAKLGAEIVPFPHFIRDERHDGVPSAEGCYMNFIYLAQGIILPAFGHRHDEHAHDILASLGKGPIAMIAARPLARLGGVFNCISLTL